MSTTNPENHITGQLPRPISRWAKLKNNICVTYVMILISSCLYVFAVQSLLRVASTLPSGMSAIALIPSIVDNTLSPYFGIFYFALNIPLILIFYKKIRRKFLYLTLLFLVFSTLLNSLFFLQEVRIFFDEIIIKPRPGKALQEIVTDEVWPILIFPAIAGVCMGFAISITWKFGGSSGGTDIIVYYMSTKHKKQVGSVSFFIALFITFIMFGVLTVVQERVRSVWLPTLVGSLIYVVTSSLSINIFYPKYTKVLLEIHSVKLKEIEKWMDLNYGHSYRIESAVSGRRKETRDFILTVMLLLEVKRFVAEIRIIDPGSWISVTKINTVFGNFNTKPVDEI